MVKLAKLNESKWDLDPRLHPYQRESVLRALNAGNRWIFNDEMGLGKTPQAIGYLRAKGAQNVLIICPAVVRSNWLRELDFWWPDHPEAVAHRWGKNNKARPKYAADWFEKPIQVVSYGMVGDLNPKGWDAIVIDEAHRLQSPSSKQSKATKSLCRGNPKAAIIGLTATIMPNQPIDVWNPVDTIFPGYFGRGSGKRAPWKFCERYCGKVPNEWAPQGYVYKGINEFYAEELQQKIAAISSRTTKDEVAHLMPAYSVGTLFVPPGGKSKYKTLSKLSQTAEDMREAIKIGGKEKVDHVIDWIEDAKAGSSHICIMCYFRDTAKALAEALRGVCKDVPVTYVSGEQTPHNRMGIIEEAKRSDRSILVATMRSVGIGIDLTRYSQAIFSELYYSPEVMEQALGRFSRMSGKVPSSVTLMVLENTLDERIAYVLQEKLEAINQAVKEGATAEQVRTSLGGEQDFIASILDKVSGVEHDEYYT